MDKQLNTTKKSLYLFLAIVGIYIINSLIIRFLYIDDIFFFNSFGGKFDSERVQKIIALDKSWGYIKLLLIPIKLFIRISLVVFCFYIGLYISGVKASMRDLYMIVIVAEFTFVIFTLIRTALIFNQNFTSFEALSSYSPFCFIPTVKLNHYPDWIKIPLGVLNPIEFIYWLVLTFLLAKTMKWNFVKSISFVLKTYVLGLLVWNVFMVFTVTIILK